MSNTAKPVLEDRDDLDDLDDFLDEFSDQILSAPPGAGVTNTATPAASAATVELDSAGSAAAPTPAKSAAQAAPLPRPQMPRLIHLPKILIWTNLKLCLRLN